VSSPKSNPYAGDDRRGVPGQTRITECVGHRMTNEPRQSSHLKEIITAVVVALLVGGTAPWWWTGLFANGQTEPSGPPANGNSLPCSDLSISLSRGSGPSGTEVTVRGSGFPSDEAVEMRFHTETLLPSRTQTDGTFGVDIVVPGTFDVFAPIQIEIRATTTPTVCFASAAFELTQ
jgi:hypothetical protein